MIKNIRINLRKESLYSNYDFQFLLFYYSFHSLRVAFSSCCFLLLRFLGIVLFIVSNILEYVLLIKLTHNLLHQISLDVSKSHLFNIKLSQYELEYVHQGLRKAPDIHHRQLQMFQTHTCIWLQAPIVQV